MRLATLLKPWGRVRRDADAAASDAPPSIADGGAWARAPDAKLHYLSAIDVFRDLPPVELERLAHATTMITCPRGRTVFRAGEASDTLFLLKRGRVQIFRESADGKRLVTALLGSDTFFGEMALIGERFPRDSSAEAVEDALICVLGRADLEDLILRHPRVGLRFLEQVSARLLDTEATVEEMAFKSVPARLAGLLLRLAEADPDGTIRASHQELADMIGTYRETATLALNDLRARGHVELGRRSVRVLDAAGLRALAEA